MSSESAHGLGPRRFEFDFPEQGAQLRVEECDGWVVVRATRDVFSRRRKEFFVRELAEEGFIPDDYRWNPLAEPGSFRGVRWVVDASWQRNSPPALVRPRGKCTSRLKAGIRTLWLGTLRLAGLLPRR